MTIEQFDMFYDHPPLNCGGWLIALLDNGNVILGSNIRGRYDTIEELCEKTHRKIMWMPKKRATQKFQKYFIENDDIIKN